jgi:hypothetical protein
VRVSSNRLAWLLIKDDIDRDTAEQRLIGQLLADCPEVRAGVELARAFKPALAEHRPDDLWAWAARATQAGVPAEITAFAEGLGPRRGLGRAGRAIEMEQRPRRGAREPHQADQAEDVRAGELRPAAGARAGRTLSGDSQGRLQSGLDPGRSRGLVCSAFRHPARPAERRERASAPQLIGSQAPDPFIECAEEPASRTYRHLARGPGLKPV